MAIRAKGWKACYHRILAELDLLITMTPTSELRNKITEINIAVMQLEFGGSSIMDEAQAREILKDHIQSDNQLNNVGRYLNWHPTVRNFEATLDGDFQAEELEAIAWWMRNKKG
jgi:hypothetical protein